MSDYTYRQWGITGPRERHDAGTGMAYADTWARHIRVMTALQAQRPSHAEWERWSLVAGQLGNERIRESMRIYRERERRGAA